MRQAASAARFVNLLTHFNLSRGIAVSFRVVLSGRALPGFTPEQIAQHLQTQLKFSEAQAKALLPPARRVVKSGLDQPSAERW